MLKKYANTWLIMSILLMEMCLGKWHDLRRHLKIEFAVTKSSKNFNCWQWTHFCSHKHHLHLHPICTVSFLFFPVCTVFAGFLISFTIAERKCWGLCGSAEHACGIYNVHCSVCTMYNLTNLERSARQRSLEEPSSVDPCWSMPCTQCRRGKLSLGTAR